MPEGKNEILRLFNEIQLGNKAAFNQLFDLYYTKLLFFAKQYTKQLEIAEEITSELFVKIWHKRADLPAVQNPEVYLYICIKNACLNLIRSDKKRIALFNVEPVENSLIHLIEDYGLSLEHKELVQMLDLAVEELPEQRRLIFKLVKEQGLKNQEVAQILGISVRTVENQVYKAIRKIADVLSGYLGYHPQANTVKKLVVSNLSLLFFV